MPEFEVIGTTERWEYHLLSIFTGKRQAESMADLNALGAQGWEAVSLSHESPGPEWVLLKRRIRG